MQCSSVNDLPEHAPFSLEETSRKNPDLDSICPTAFDILDGMKNIRNFKRQPSKRSAWTQSCSRPNPCFIG
jgi:hypothetical protein